MSKTISMQRDDIGPAHLKCNGQERETFEVVFADEDGWVRATLEHEIGSLGFEYRGSIYALDEFEIAPHWLKAQGFDGWQPESAFSAVVVKYFDEFGDTLEGVIVGYVHW